MQHLFGLKKFVDFAGNRDVTEDNVLRDFDFPKHIVPESDDSSMESFDDFDPPIFVAYTDFGSFAPVATTIVHQTVDSEIMDESPSCVLPDVSSEVHNSSVATKQYIPQWQCSNFFSPSNSILPPGNNICFLFVLFFLEEGYGNWFYKYFQFWVAFENMVC